ncbi:MAG: hypothetical protein QOH00_3714 [Gaiellales bacterium]|nr:hypothetical protein [Gaiellales bacterium]
MIVLENALVRAEIAPEQGARVCSLQDRRSGRELLYRRADERWDPDAYLPTLAGGWDQMFPNDDVWLDWPVHGALWSAAFPARETSPVQAVLCCSLQTPQVDVEHCYELLAEPRAGVRLTTTVHARTAVGPFLWATHPMLAVAPGWRIEVGDATLEADRLDPGRARPGHVSAAGREAVLCLPRGNQGWQEVIYAQAAGEASVASPDARNRTRVHWDESFFRHLWIVTLSGFESVDLALVLEPCTTKPYRLDEAIAAARAESLEAGERRTFWSEVESLDAT